MNKSSKIFFMGIIGVCAICLLIGIKVRGSIKDLEYKDVSNQAGEYSYNIRGNTNDVKNLSLDKIKDELENESDVIVTGSFTGKRKMIKESVLSEVSILKTYKGDTKLKNIYIYEPVFSYLFIDGPFKGSVISEGGYGLMNEGKEYLLFLKEESNSPEFGYLKKSDKAFTYVNNEFGKLCIEYDKNDYKVVKENKDGKDRYNEFKGYEQVISNEEVFDFYNQLREIVLDRYSL
ncbi:hypothetical protein J1C67_11495 [Clostridium gasigenes]|uniref:hypothetical protein n=1 Tax=Clostridium gasigenes TaxID=94869 RepID=UPI0014382D61|nr:hypothetical protein [Clostridium gasigenes]NKF07209.1 hypothetical protein [Clostridium gasigenes]QSW18192.1 hypothetical protein J1C67_11495 [Clostridium gasigenes]